MTLMVVHSALALAFGTGVLASAGRNRPLRIAGRLLVAIGVVDVVAPFFPMHRREAEETLTDTMHVIVTGVTVLLVVLAMGFAAAALGSWFRRYSTATILTLLVFGALAGAQGARVAAGEPTPWLGVQERINVGGYLMWMAVLAVVLLRSHDTCSTGPEPEVVGRHALDQARWGTGSPSRQSTSTGRLTRRRPPAAQRFPPPGDGARGRFRPPHRLHIGPIPAAHRRNTVVVSESTAGGIAVVVSIALFPRGPPRWGLAPEGTRAPAAQTAATAPRRGTAAASPQPVSST